MNTSPSARLAQAWTLKRACYQAWHTDPTRAPTIAAELDCLLAEAVDGPDARTLRALSEWVHGIAELTASRLATGLERLRAAQAAFEAAGDAQNAAETMVPQLVALLLLGHHDAVMATGEDALARFERLGDDVAAGKVEINLGSHLSRLDRHTEAERLFRSAAARGARSGQSELAAMAGIGVANALTWQFEGDRALTACAEAATHARAGGYRILYAQTLEATGRIEMNRGRTVAALAALTEALAVLEAAGAPPQRRLECETALAEAYQAANLVDEALRQHERVADAARSLGAPKEQAWALMQRARVLLQCGQPAQARADLAAARGIGAGLGNRALLALIDLGLARVALLLGEAPAARASADAAVEALRQSGIVGWTLSARATQAAVLAAAGERAAAVAAFETTLADARRLSQPDAVFDCLVGLGSLLATAGDRERAQALLVEALDRVDVDRASLPGDELRSATGILAQQAHERLLDLALGDPDDAALLRVIERGRARALALALALADAMPSADAATADDVAGLRLPALREAWRQALGGGDEDRLPALSQALRDAERGWQSARLRQTLRTAPGAIAGTETETETETDATDLQRRLAPRQALVHFHLHRDRLITLVATDQGLHRQVAPLGDLVERVRAMRFQIEAPRTSSPAMRRHETMLAARLQAHARHLYEQLWAPIEPALAGRDAIVVVPHGALHDLPLAALHDGRGWLVERLTLSLAPSAAVFASSRRRGPDPGLAAPARVFVAGAGGPSLAHAAREVEAVGALYGTRATVVQGVDAESLARHAADADLVHLACHGRFRADNPAFSYLRLADGPLPMHELSRLRLLAAPLVVLSACDTGVSARQPGDEAFGLVRAFMLAGARRVVASLWPVDDAATAVLMERFHRQLQRGDAPARALRLAQVAVAAEWHPYHWAAFVVHDLG